MKGALDAGFVLRVFQEPTATEDDLRKSIRFEHMTRIPYFLFMRWEKPAACRARPSCATSTWARRVGSAPYARSAITRRPSPRTRT